MILDFVVRRIPDTLRWQASVSDCIAAAFFMLGSLFRFVIVKWFEFSAAGCGKSVSPHPSASHLPVAHGLSWQSFSVPVSFPSAFDTVLLEWKQHDLQFAVSGRHKSLPRESQWFFWHELIMSEIHWVTCPSTADCKADYRTGQKDIGNARRHCNICAHATQP